MRLFGYDKIVSEDEGNEIIEMRIVEIWTTSDNIRKMGQFILDTIDEMEQLGDDFDLRRLKDKFKEFDTLDEPDLVIKKLID